MKTKLAVAMALVVAGIGIGLAPAPFVAAQSPNCSADFSIADSENDADDRPLAALDSEIGVEDVLSVTGTERLHVKLITQNDEMEWTVFHLDSQSNCVEFTQGGCDGPSTLDQENEEQTCDLPAPSVGSKDYWVVSENVENDALEYRIWVE